MTPSSVFVQVLLVSLSTALIFAGPPGIPISEDTAALSHEFGTHSAPPQQQYVFLRAEDFTLFIWQHGTYPGELQLKRTLQSIQSVYDAAGDEMTPSNVFLHVLLVSLSTALISAGPPGIPSFEETAPLALEFGVHSAAPQQQYLYPRAEKFPLFIWQHGTHTGEPT